MLKMRFKSNLEETAKAQKNSSYRKGSKNELCLICGIINRHMLESIYLFLGRK